MSMTLGNRSGVINRSSSAHNYCDSPKYINDSLPPG